MNVIIVERRAKALRQRYTLQAEMLRQSIELRVGRIPYKMRSMTMGELFEQHSAIEASKENGDDIRKVINEIEDVKRLR